MIGLLCKELPQSRYQEKEMSNVGYHEPVAELSAEARDMHRALFL